MALMVIYDLDADSAFDMLRWRSQTTNAKVRCLAIQLMEDLRSHSPLGPEVRAACDDLLLTVHERVGDPSADDMP